MYEKKFSKDHSAGTMHFWFEGEDILELSSTILAEIIDQFWFSDGE